MTMRPTTVRFSRELVASVSRLAAAEGISMAQWVREAIMWDLGYREGAAAERAKGRRRGARRPADALEVEPERAERGRPVTLRLAAPTRGALAEHGTQLGLSVSGYIRHAVEARIEHLERRTARPTGSDPA